MIYGYIRVSSDKQTVENQRFEINNFCKQGEAIIIFQFQCGIVSIYYSHIIPRA